MVPLHAIGPSWAVWPTAADLVVIVIAPLAFLQPMLDRTTRRVWEALVITVLVCLASFVGLTVLNVLGLAAFGTGKGIVAGEYGIYRLVQVLVIYRAVSSCEFTTARLKVLRYVSMLTFCLICAGVWATAFNVISPALLSSHLPQAKIMAGAWFYYMHNGEPGLGAISYNHGYVAMQLILAAALALSLNDANRRGSVVRAAVLVLCMGSVFLTGSRAGFIGAAVFAILQIAAIKRGAILALSTFVACSALCIVFIDPLASLMNSAAERQATISSSYEYGGLSGRTEIWDERVEFLRSEPMRFFVGSGFGSAMESGSNAHMMFLQVLMELGLSGALIFCWLGARVAQSLGAQRGVGMGVLHGSIALLVTCLTQETFYPVPAFAHFLCFYFVVVALVIRYPRPSALTGRPARRIGWIAWRNQVHAS